MTSSTAGITLTRHELYDQVWSTPMRKLCEQYSISDRRSMRPARGTPCSSRRGPLDVTIVEFGKGVFGVKATSGDCDLVDRPEHPPFPIKKSEICYGARLSPLLALPPQRRPPCRSRKAENLAAAATLMSTSPGAMQLGTLQTIDGLGPSASNTVVLAVPIEILELVRRTTENLAPARQMTPAGHATSNGGTWER